MPIPTYKQIFLAAAIGLVALCASAETQFGPGAIDVARPIVVSRQRAMKPVPAPYGASQTQLPGDAIGGRDMFGTVLRFSSKFNGPLIKSEGFGEGTTSAYWNDGNKLGDTKLRANLCSYLHDFTVDGRAEIRPYPWDYNEWHPKPDVHGPDTPQRADGICLEGSGHRIERVRLYQIPGTAIVLKGGKNPQAGVYGLYDTYVSNIADVEIQAAIRGIDVQAGDARLRNILIRGCVKDALTLSGPGTVVIGDHLEGADRGCVVAQEADLTAVYHESARIGTDIMPTAHGTRIAGLNIGPATCWERGVRIGAHGCKIAGLFGTVRGTDKQHPDIAGVEILPRLTHEVATGQLVMEGDGSVGVILRGARNKIDLDGGWNGKHNSTFVRVAEAVTGCSVELRCSGDDGCFLDLRDSGLDRANGLGNEFKVKGSGTATRVLYPGGGTKFNLVLGTQLWIDGVLQQ